MSDPRKPWEPDPAKLGNNWASMFEPQARQAASHPPHAAPTVAEAFDDAEMPGIDLTEYRPWILQRGRSHSAMMLALRWFDAKAGLWYGSAVAYPSLYAIDIIGDRVVSLDFGSRQFAIEGSGLDVLERHLQQGSVLKIVEYAAPIWPSRIEGPVVTAIRRVAPPT